MSTAHVHAVLVVDGESELREEVVALLESEDFEAIAVPSGEEGIALLGLGYQPCLLLVAMHLPGMDGIEFWRRSRAAGLTSAPVVLLATYRADVARARRLGLREVLPKPVAEAALLAMVQRHCERRRAS